MTQTDPKDCQVKIRLAAPLRDWLKAEAASNHRSLLGEIAARLEQSQAQQQPQGAAQ